MGSSCARRILQNPRQPSRFVWPFCSVSAAAIAMARLPVVLDTAEHRAAATADTVAPAAVPSLATAAMGSRLHTTHCSRISRATAHSAPARALQHVIGEAAIPPQLEPSNTNSNAQVASAAAPQHVIGEVAFPPRLEPCSTSSVKQQSRRSSSPASPTATRKLLRLPHLSTSSTRSQSRQGSSPPHHRQPAGCFDCSTAACHRRGRIPAAARAPHHQRRHVSRLGCNAAASHHRRRHILPHLQQTQHVQPETPSLWPAIAVAGHGPAGARFHCGTTLTSRQA
uniref:Uncharacterized protein n=1 Tax=Anopheles gambiae TaxID=7165 RepID=A0A0E4C713_ANOGA